MTPSHLSLLASKAVYAAVGSRVETEKWWVDCRDNPYEESDPLSPTWNIENNHVGYRYYVPAYTFVELLRAVEVLSVDKRWGSVIERCPLCSKPSMPKKVVYVRHMLMSTLVAAQYDMSSPEMERVVMRLFNSLL